MMTFTRTGHRVLIGTAGTGTSWGILVSLRESFPDTYIVATDMAPAHLVAASAEADRFQRVPAVDDEMFVEFLLELLREADIDTYVPTHDTEVTLAAILREKHRLNGVTCPAPPSWASALCWDKLALATWLTERGFPTPPTVSAAQLKDIGSGWFVKPRHGVGSVGAERLMSGGALELWRRDREAALWVAQPLLAGPEVTIDAFIAADGRGAAVCRERVEVKSGVCTKARVFHHSQLEALALEVGRNLQFRGAFCVQTMKAGEGDWQLTDVNPRPGAGTRIAAAVGFNTHAAMFADLWGEDARPHLRRLETDRWVVRQYKEVVLA